MQEIACECVEEQPPGVGADRDGHCILPFGAPASSGTHSTVEIRPSSGPRAGFTVAPPPPPPAIGIIDMRGLRPGGGVLSDLGPATVPKRAVGAPAEGAGRPRAGHSKIWGGALTGGTVRRLAGAGWRAEIVGGEGVEGERGGVSFFWSDGTVAYVRIMLFGGRVKLSKKWLTKKKAGKSG